MKPLSRVQLFATLWTVAYQASQSMGFSKQEYWSGLPFPITAFLIMRTGILEHWSCTRHCSKPSLCEGDVSFDIPYMWNIKRNDTSELTYKTERDSNLENELTVATGKG